MKTPFFILAAIIFGFLCFAVGALCGYGGLLIVGITATYMLVTLCAVVAAVIVCAAVYALGAKGAGAKPRWDRYATASAWIFLAAVALSMAAGVLAALTMRF